MVRVENNRHSPLSLALAATDLLAEADDIQKSLVTGEVAEWPVYDRAQLRPGARIRGPAIIAEDETSTLVGPGWRAGVDRLGYLELEREG